MARAVGIVLLTCSLQLAQAATQTVADGTYRLVSKWSNKVMDVDGSSAANSAIIEQNTYSSSTTSQEWIVVHVGSGYYRFINANSNRALDVSAKSTENGADVIQYAYNGGNNQLWEITPIDTSGYYAVINKNSGKALDVWDWATADGARLSQYTYWAGDTQYWEMKYMSCVVTYGGTCSSSGATGSATGYAAGTLGGTGGSTVTVSTCSALTSAVSGNSAKIVKLANAAIDCRTSARSVAVCVVSCDDGSDWYRVPTSTQTCTSLGAKSSSTVTTTRNEISITVGSYTTIVGTGSSSAVYGASLDLRSKTHIIMQNFKLTQINPALVEAGDGVAFSSTSYVWIDHMTFSYISDGYFDIKDSSYVTVSYTHIDGYNTQTCEDQHWYVALVEDSTVTFHHNFWDTAAGRNPKVLGSSARAHLYNNYWKDIYYFCISSNDNAIALVENNYFEDSRYPHWVDGGSIQISGNTYTGASTTSGTGRSSGGSSFTPPYSYSLSAASTLPSTIPSLVGPVL